jgi:ClpP class serine protease
VYERLTKEGVAFQTVTAGEFKRTLTPFKKIDPKDVAKTEEEIGEIFALFKSFVGKQRPQLDIDSVATGETWFGEDALERQLADKLQTYDDLLLELHTSGVEIFAITYRKPDDSPLAKLGIGVSADAPTTRNWLTRVVAAAVGLPLPHADYSAMAVAPSRNEPQFRDPRF